MKKLLFIIIILFLSLILLFLCFKNHESHSVLEEDFIINKPYLFVVKSLATKESLEKNIEDSDGKLKRKQWRDFTVEVPRRILQVREYKLEGLLDFSVEKHDDSLGKLDLEFEQSVKADKNLFLIKTNLKKPNSKVLICDKFIEISPNDSSTQVKIKNELKIKKFIPFFLTELMDRRVKKNNQDDLDRFKNSLISATEGSEPIIKFK